MSRTLLVLVASLTTIPLLPPAAGAQVNLPTFRNLATGELIEQPYAERYQQWLRDRDRRVQLRRSEQLLNFPDDRAAAYYADACGLGCEGHEGLQVRRIPGTHIAAVVYKAFLDEEVLTVQLRFHNDGFEPARLTMDPAPAGSVFVRVSEETHPLLLDEDGEQQSKGAIEEMLEPGEIESWWARFPAPRGATTFDFHIPAVTFRDVPLAD